MIDLLYSGNEKVFDGVLTSLLSIVLRDPSHDEYHVTILTMDLTRLNPDYTPISDKLINFLDGVMKRYNEKSYVRKVDVTGLYEEFLGHSPNEGCYCSPYTLLRLLTDKVDGFDVNYFPGADGGKGVYYGGAFGYDMRCVVNTGDEMFVLCAFSISKTFELMPDDTRVKNYPVQLIANGVAYLCSTNADIIPSYTPQKNLKRNNAKRRSTATWHEVGYRIGSELREYKHSVSRTGGGGGWTVRPHMRRAHWHHYWVGPRDGERKLVLKWLAPTMVGVGKIGAATVHHVS